MRPVEARIWVAWLLLAVTVLYLLTGFGITNHEIVGPLTAGLLGKALSYRLHDTLWIPFIVLLTVHVTWSVGRRFRLFK